MVGPKFNTIGKKTPRCCLKLKLYPNVRKQILVNLSINFLFDAVMGIIALGTAQSWFYISNISSTFTSIDSSVNNSLISMSYFGYLTMKIKGKQNKCLIVSLQIANLHNKGLCLNYFLWLMSNWALFCVFIYTVFGFLLFV